MYIAASFTFSTYSGQSFVWDGAHIRAAQNERDYYVPRRGGCLWRALASMAICEKLSHPIPAPEEVMPTTNGAGAIPSSVRGHGESYSKKTEWLALLLNEGVNPLTNATIIPKSAFEASTMASAIISGMGNAYGVSIAGHCMGWIRTVFWARDSNARRRDARILELGAVPAAREAGDGILDEYGRLEDNTFGDYPVYAGTYYGKCHLLLLPHRLTAVDRYASSNDYRSSLLRTFTLVDTARGQAQFSGTLQLLSALPRIWSTHLRLAHDHGDTFTFKPITLFPYGFGDDVGPLAYAMEVGPTTTRFVLGGFNSSSGLG
ncbi:hypothetical protein EW145_g5058 [Phellinidium pouzarii]|uniref:Uncharacterized protein n=1 Tax=Phellinidium pouzarii TaxID=167371 RepID=A0A4V3XCA4_9AGAM|nr:hypothetical protein EW145_g5058 [Phellinidium pouzarii]